MIRCQLAVGVELGDIYTGIAGSLARRPEGPVEAHQVVVGVDGARTPHHQAGELGLDGAEHGVEGVAAVGLEHRVAVPEVGAEGGLDEGGAGVVVEHFQAAR